MQDRQGQTIPESPRPVLDPYGTACWVSILLSTKLVKDVTRFTALKITAINAKKQGYPCWMSNQSTWIKGECTLFYSCFSNCRRLAYEISAHDVRIICPKLIAAWKIHYKSLRRRPDGLIMLDWFMVLEATLSAYIRESVYVRSHMGCGRVHQTLLLHVPQIFQRHKIYANKRDFKTKLNLTYQARSTPKIIGIITEVFCTSGPNLVTLAWTDDELSCRQAHDWRTDGRTDGRTHRQAQATTIPEG